MPGGGVAIVGMAALFPGASDLERYRRNLVDGVDAIREIPPGRLDPVFFDEKEEDPARFYCRRGGFVDEDALFDPLEYGVMPVVVEGSEPDQMIALRIASAALGDAGPASERVARERVGVILGRGGYLTRAQSRLNEWVRTAEQVVACVRDVVPGVSEEQLRALRTRFRESIGPQRPESVVGIVPNLAASRIANRLDLGGPAYLVDAACASSLIAVEHAVRELESGRCDLVLAGGVHHCHDTTLWSLFTQLRAVSPSHQIRPFDRRADGLLIGEGTGIVALRRLEDAERDGDRIYAVVRGCGIASDGRESSVMNPRVEGQVLALERAYREAGFDPGSIGLIEAHGTATQAGDQAELETLARFFGPAGDGARAGIGTVKSMIGHAMPAAGIAGLIKAALAVHHGLLLPTLHCEEPLETMGRTRFRPIAKTEPWESAGAPRRAGVNAFGFGGVNAHVVLESHGEPAQRSAASAGGAALGTAVAEAPEPIWVFAADDCPALLRQLEDAVERGAPEPLPAQPGPVRLAIANPNARRVALARSALERGRAWRGRNDVWFSPSGLMLEGGKLAFVFPGIEPVEPDPIDDIAALFGGEAPAVREGDLHQRARNVFHIGCYLDEALRALGVSPDLVTGHSLGEWSAMVSAGMVSEESVDAFRDGLDDLSLEVPDVVYLAGGCSAEAALSAVEDAPDVVLSHDNCPHQAVLCGRSEPMAQVRQRMRERRILTEELTFQSGFHSRFFEPHMARSGGLIEQVPLRAPRLPIWSAISCEPYPEGEAAVRELLYRFHVEPVRFRKLTERLHAHGVRVFVQLGLGSTMRFASDTLRSEDHLAVSLLESGRSGMAQLRRAAAALFTEGAPVDLARVLPEVASAPPRRSAGGAPLKLGSELVHLQGFELGAPASAGAPADEPTGLPAGPLADEFGAALREASEASRAVAALWSRGSAPAEPRAAQAVPPPREARERVERIGLSLDVLPEIADHCLYPQPEGWTDWSDRFPVVPMTTLIALIGEAARRLVPELRVVGYERILALRWLPIAPPVELEIRARFDGVDRVQVTLDRYARGTVRMAADYPAPPQADDRPLEPLDDAQPCPVRAEEFYEGRWMFHGPQYQGVDAFEELGSNGIDAVLRARPAKGQLLDNAGQLMGFWVLLNTERDRFAFPFQIERIDLFGPEPADGTRVGCQVRIDSLAESSVRANLDLRVDDRLWARIRGWEDRRFETTERSWNVFIYAGTSLLAEPGSRPYVLVRPHWRTAAGREVMMRRYLSAAERVEYAAQLLNAQGEWLLDRIAAKDAVRRWLFERGRSPVFPIEVALRRGTEGEWVASGPFEEDLRVVAASRRDLAVALLTEGRPGQIALAARSGSSEAGEPGEADAMDSSEEGDCIVRWRSVPSG